MDAPVDRLLGSALVELLHDPCLCSVRLIDHLEVFPCGAVPLACSGDVGT
jgi:hypothetical protein